MALNFADITAKKIDTIERPPLPPVGTYRFIITKLPETSTTNDGAWDIVNVNCRAVEALDDVDTSDYKGDIKGILQSVRFMFNKNDEIEFEKSLYRMKTFFEKHVKCAEPGDTIAQLLNNSVNQEFLGTIAWKQDKNDHEMFHANISRTAPIE